MVDNLDNIITKKIEKNISKNIQIILTNEDFLLLREIINREANKDENLFDFKLIDLNYRLNNINYN